MIKKEDIKKGRLYNLICIKPPDRTIDPIFETENEYKVLKIYELMITDLSEDAGGPKFPYVVAIEKGKFNHYLFSLDEINQCFRMI